MSDDESWRLDRDPDLESRRLDWVASLRRDTPKPEDGPEGLPSPTPPAQGSPERKPAAGDERSAWGPPVSTPSPLVDPPDDVGPAVLDTGGNPAIDVDLPIDHEVDVGAAGLLTSEMAIDATEVLPTGGAPSPVVVTGEILITGPTAAVGTPTEQMPVVPAKRRHRLRRTILWMLAVLVAYFGANFVQVWMVGRSDQARAVDAIVVLGAAQYDGRPSPQLAARLDHAADLHTLGIAPIIVVTGGNQPGDRFTEAEASADYLVDRGVSPDAIIAEDQGRTTWESLSGVAELLDQRGLDRVILVTDPYHSLRSRLIAEDAGLTAYVSPTRSSPVKGADALIRQLKEAVGVSIGRVIGFERLARLTD